jgi:hypothetical protein
VDSQRIEREAGLGLATATRGSARLLHQSPRACRCLILLILFYPQIYGKRVDPRGLEPLASAMRER